MKKIPVKIIEFSDGDKMIQEVMIDLVDSIQLEGDPGKKIDIFRDKYFKLVKKAEKLFFGSNLKKTRSKNLTSSTCWKLGNLFRKFDDDIKNDFIITNYTEALERDFGRSAPYIRELIEFSKLFEEKEILDSIPMAIYRALVWKKNQLEQVGILEKEKNRLTKMGKHKNVPGREQYKIELIDAIDAVQSKKKSKSRGK
jgi:hypothetical protein